MGTAAIGLTSATLAKHLRIGLLVRAPHIIRGLLVIDCMIYVTRLIIHLMQKDNIKI